MITLSVHNMDKVEQRLNRLAAAAGLGVRDVANEVMRLACQNAVKFTVPKTGKMGRDRVEKDINKVFEPVPTPQRKKTWRQESRPGIVFLKGIDGLDPKAVVQVPDWRFQPKAGEAAIRRIHEKERLSRGRVGRRAAKNPTYIKQADLRRYISKRKKRVGRLKAGWLPGLDHYAREAGTSPKGVPAFVRNQATKEGHVSGRISRGGSGAIETHNDVPYITDKKRAAILDIVHEIADKDLKTHANRMLFGRGGLVERFNEGRRLAA